MSALDVTISRNSMGKDHLHSDHGGELVSLIAAPERACELQSQSQTWPSWDLTARQLHYLELLLNGGFSPLRGFMSRADYEAVCSSMRLADGRLWPLPVVLDVPEKFARSLGPGASVALRDPEGVMLAVLHVEEIWQPDRAAEAEAVYGFAEDRTRNAEGLLQQTHPFYVGGRVEGIRLPAHYDFKSLRFTAAELRAEFARLGWHRIAAFHSQDLMHQAEYEFTLRAARQLDAHLLIHASVGEAGEGGLEDYVKVRCHKALLPAYPEGMAKLALVPAVMGVESVRQILGRAIIASNYGCTHLIVERKHSDGMACKNGRPLCAVCAAQRALEAREKELGVTVVPFNTMLYLEDRGAYVPADEVPRGAKSLALPRTEIQRLLNEGRPLPRWFTSPEVARELQASFPPRALQGFTVFFTGLSGSGKSTIANILRIKFQEIGGRPVTLLDGDRVRKHLSSELGFSREHRDINIRRIGYVASEITKNGGVAICAPIAPYDLVRKEVRAAIQPHGGFILVHLSTDLATCEARDRKGLYAKARAGLVQQFTGISDPYEPPPDAEVVIDTARLCPEEAAQQILCYLERQGYIGSGATGEDRPLG